MAEDEEMMSKKEIDSSLERMRRFVKVLRDERTNLEGLIAKIDGIISTYQASMDSHDEPPLSPAAPSEKQDRCKHGVYRDQACADCLYEAKHLSSNSGETASVGDREAAHAHALEVARRFSTEYEICHSHISETAHIAFLAGIAHERAKGCAKLAYARTIVDKWNAVIKEKEDEIETGRQWELEGIRQYEELEATLAARDSRIAELEEALGRITIMPWFSFGNGRWIQDEAQTIAREALEKK